MSQLKQINSVNILLHILCLKKQLLLAIPLFTRIHHSRYLHMFYLEVFTLTLPPKDFVSAPRIKLVITALWNHLHIQCLKKAVITVTDVWLKLTSQPGTINQSTEDKAMCGISYAFSAVNLSVWYQHNLHNTWDSIYGHVSYPFNQGHGWGCLLSTDNVCYTWKDISTNFLLLYWRDQNQQLVCLSDSILFAPQALFIPAVNTCSKCKSVQFVCLYMFWLLFDYKVIFGP